MVVTGDRPLVTGTGLINGFRSHTASPQGLKPTVFLALVRRGWKPRPFKTIYETSS